MQTLLKTKIGPFLVISSVLAIWTFLVAQHVQAHPRTTSLPTPSCSGLPGDAFFGADKTASITASTPAPTGTFETKRGGGTSGTGDIRYHYAKIMIPALTAGELRVFDPGNLSNAVLCRDSSQVARSITTYGAHNTAHTAAAAADDDETTTDDFSKAVAAAVKADEANNAANVQEVIDAAAFDTSGPDDNADGKLDDHDATDSNGNDRIDADERAPITAARNVISSALSTARSALSTARSALSTARSDLATAARALNAASTSLSDEAKTAAETAANDAATAEQNALDALNAAANALPPSSTPNITELAEVRIALGNLGNDPADALNAAATALNVAADALNTAASNMHTGFKIRAAVSPGDEEYIVVVAPENTGTPPRAGLPTATRNLNVAFHGAIATTATEQRTRVLNNDAVDTISLTITAPGLLTLETTGNVDTIGTLYNSTPTEVAQAEDGGSGDNFKFVVPVTLATAGTAEAYSVTVEEGQTSGGEYTLNMDFRVAMTTSSGIADVPVAAAPTWTPTVDQNDDTPLQIKKIAADGNTADEDYFLFTPAASGLLTVNANDDIDGSKKDANTSGTLFGAMETGPLGERRVGEIATDSDSGPGNHFKFAVPVAADRNYLVKVEGTDGYYTLMFDFDQTTADIMPTSSHIPTALDPDCPGTNRGEICRSTGAPEIERYLLNITGPGALYLHSTGGTDVVGVLYGPDGKQVAMDDVSGEGTNFRIATNVDAGLYLLEVKGQTKATQGVYGLVSNFVTGDVVTTPTTPGTGTGTEVADLRARVAELEDDLATCETPVETDARGALGNPSGGGFRSGIGIISGWVCEAKEVEVRIYRSGALRLTLDVAYGTSRPDTVGECDHNSPNTGFGMTYNFNHLPEGVHTIRAYADDELIGAQQTFEVVHLRPFAANDDNRFLIGLPVAECRVENFPAAGEDTFLLWEESTQNFVIEDAG